jgi:hypothetical protein
MARLFCLVSLVVGAGAAAQEPLDPDTQAARRHFERGLALYLTERYREALHEFETARTTRPVPAFDFNIGRCHERLEEWGAAASAYERYLSAAPGDPDAATIRERLVVLRDRARLKEGGRIRRAAIGVGVGTVAAGAVWAGLVGSVGVAYHDALARCSPTCVAAEVDPLRAKQNASYAFAAVGLLGLVVDVALWASGGARRR